MAPFPLQMLPFNISLLILNAADYKDRIKEIKVLDIFDGGGMRNFHADGLFSVEIFGKVGSEARNRTFGYMDLHVPIFHPVIYKELCDLKELYGAVIAGTAYAVFDPKTKDFLPATIVNGRTGFNFFMEHFHELQFEQRKSTSRTFGINLVEKYRDNCMMDKLLVMPAGLRDYTIDENSKPSEDEVNTLYRQIFSLSNLMSVSIMKTDPEHLDSARAKLQLKVYELYEYIGNLIRGKSKLIGGWWTSRRITNSTRNVITSNVHQADHLDSPTLTDSNDTVVGLYQTIRSIFPITVHEIRRYSSSIFPNPNSPAVLVDPKTFKKTIVQVSPEHYDNWMTQEGIEGILDEFEVENNRHDPIMIEGKAFALTYRTPTGVRICHGIEDLPEELQEEAPKYLSPTTYAEFFYYVILKATKNLHVFVTRYPVIGYGGIYPSRIYLKTTINSYQLKEIGDDWKETDFVYPEFPVVNEVFVNSMSPSIHHYPALGADNDGDMTNCVPLMTDDANQEVSLLLDNWDYYVSVDGSMNFSAANDVSNLVFKTMSDE